MAVRAHADWYDLKNIVITVALISTSKNDPTHKEVIDADVGGDNHPHRLFILPMDNEKQQRRQVLPFRSRWCRCHDNDSYRIYALW